MANAGHFGYFSERSVVNLDGLVGTLGFQDVLLRHELNDFLELLRPFGLVEMAIFIFILALGLFYAWRKGVLRWI